MYINIFSTYIFTCDIASYRKERVLPSSINSNLGNSMIKVNCVQKAEFTILLKGIMEICNYQKRSGFTTQVISTWLHKCFSSEFASQYAFNKEVSKWEKIIFSVHIMFLLAQSVSGNPPYFGCHKTTMQFLYYFNFSVSRDNSKA